MLAQEIREIREMRGVRIRLPIGDLLRNRLRQSFKFWFVLVPQTYVTRTKIYGLNTLRGRDSQYMISWFGAPLREVTPGTAT